MEHLFNEVATQSNIYFSKFANWMLQLLTSPAVHPSLLPKKLSSSSLKHRVCKEQLVQGGEEGAVAKVRFG